MVSLPFFNWMRNCLSQAQAVGSPQEEGAEMLGPDAVLRMTVGLGVRFCRERGQGRASWRAGGGVGLGGALRVQLPSPLVSSFGEKSLVPSLGSFPRPLMAPAPRRHISRAR